MFASKDLIVTLVISASAVIAGLSLDELGWCLFAGALVWIWLQGSEFRKVQAWSKHPLRRPANGLDSWFALAYRPYRSLATERQRTRTMAARLREVLGLAEVIPDGVIVLNSYGDIEGLNSAAKELLQLSDNDVGLGLATVVRSPDFVSFIHAGHQDEPLDFTSPFQPERSFEARRFDVGTGRTIILLRDITALNRLLTMRQNFVANVSHELRTPLTVVSGYLETMIDPEQPDELKLSLIERLVPPLKRMQTLVDDLMLLTQLESTPITGRRQPIDMAQVIDGAVSEVRPLCERADQIHIRHASNHSICGVAGELHSVCVNLLSNALRYSPAGSPIEISFTDYGDKTRLMVKDQGYGIAPEHLSHITERFYRVDMAGARARGGTGLGLAIVKHVLRRHDSELQVHSTLGSGSSFFCDFKRADNPALQPSTN